MKKALALFGLSATFLFASPARADQPEIITLAKSQDWVANSTKVQHFSDSIDLQKGEEKLQLTLTYENGDAKAPGYKWLRIASSSMNFISEQQFHGKDLSVDVSGELTWGGNQMLITAAGEPGATFRWVLTTPKPTITGVQPPTCNAGQQLTITGTNFAAAPNDNAVTINGSPARIISAQADKIVVDVPENAQSGKAVAALTVAGINCGTVQFAVNSQPSLTRLSSSWVAPGNAVTIFGDNFGTDASQVAVYIGPERAAVVSVAPNQIVANVPPNYYTPWAGYYMPVKVAINGVKARNTLTISCSVDTGP